jgi:hypothetical protein
MWSLLLSVLPGLAGAVLKHFEAKADRELQGFTTATGADLEAFRAYMAAQIEVNRMKLAQNAWWGAKLIILTTGIPASLHFAAVFLDTLIPPFGSWGVPRLPAPYDTYQWAIVQSFFLVMPVQTGINALAQWLNRGR